MQALAYAVAAFAFSFTDGRKKVWEWVKVVSSSGAGRRGLGKGALGGKHSCELKRRRMIASVCIAFGL